MSTSTSKNDRAGFQQAGEAPKQAPAPVASAVIAREAAIAAAAAAGLAALVAPGDLGLSLHPHPIWAVVLILAARYGSRGFAFALPAVWVALALTALATGMGAAPLMAIHRAPAEVAALAVSVLVAWVASVHERRATAIGARAFDLESRATESALVVNELRDAAVAMRARADRLDHSITFLREVATEMESGDPIAGSLGALDLAIARTGARAGVVQLGERGRLRTVASRGAWSAESPTPPDLMRDRTAHAAFETGKPARATDLSDSGADDSDLAAPIVSEAGEILGVLALRGVPADSLRPSLVHDVALVALWCARPLASATADRRATLRGFAPGPQAFRQLAPVANDPDDSPDPAPAAAGALRSLSLLAN